MAELKSTKKKKTKLINVKVDEDQNAKMQENADKFCKGNLSEWIRYSSIELKPKKSDIVE